VPPPTTGRGLTSVDPCRRSEAVTSRTSGTNPR
jgi:hypothetical protein